MLFTYCPSCGVKYAKPQADLYCSKRCEEKAKAKLKRPSPSDPDTLVKK